MEPNRNNLECGLCQQDASGPPLWTLFFSQRTDVQSMLPLRNVGLPLATDADKLISWPHGLWVLTPAMQNWILWSPKTCPPVCEPGVMGTFCWWACPGGSPVESLKISWERSLCYLGLNKNGLLLLTSPSQYLNKLSQHFREMTLYSWLKDIYRKHMKTSFFFVTTVPVIHFICCQEYKLLKSELQAWFRAQGKHLENANNSAQCVVGSAPSLSFDHVKGTM